MARVAFLIDGFNVYHALDEAPVYSATDDRDRYQRYKWLDYSKLAKCFARGQDQLARILYFTAYTILPGDSQAH